MIFERIDDEHARAKIFGGWLVEVSSEGITKMHPDTLPSAGCEWRVSICFVPDPNHEWVIEEE